MVVVVMVVMMILIEKRFLITMRHVTNLII